MPIPTYTIDRRTTPHQRCGICDEPIETGERTCVIDDERCHVDCARDPQSRFDLALEGLSR